MSEVVFSIDGHVARVHLNRPAALNAINAAMNLALRDIWREVNANPSIWLVVLTAEGEKAFCVGGDLKEGQGPSERIGLGGGITGIGGPLLTVTKPVIAGVQGHVLGGGFELAMCADIIVAADTAKFALPETALGVIGECGVVHRAMRQLPYRVAMALILTGERLSAGDALHHGLINQVVPFDAMEAAIAQWCDRVLAASPLAVQAAKDAALSRLNHPLEVALATRFEKIEHYSSTSDYAEFKSAFLTKSTPRWKGY
ncbi:enoyl-CoA hydratase-related protein [soil metagenome]